MSASAFPNDYTHPRSLLTSPQSLRALQQSLPHVDETAVTSPVSPTSPTTNPSSKISREELARIVAARAQARKVILPDTEEWVEARREPLKKSAVKIRAKFEGPEVRRCKPYSPNGRLTPVGGKMCSGGTLVIPIILGECYSPNFRR